jgi:hypothetical protein
LNVTPWDFRHDWYLANCAEVPDDELAELDDDDDDEPELPQAATIAAAAIASSAVSSTRGAREEVSCMIPFRRFTEKRERCELSRRRAS